MASSAVAKLLESRIPGFRAHVGGGEELRRATAALTGGRADDAGGKGVGGAAGHADAAAASAAAASASREPREPLAVPPLPSTLPPMARQILESPCCRAPGADPRTRELACAVALHASAAAADAGDAQAHHHLALALQELALRPGIGRGLSDEDGGGEGGGGGGGVKGGGGGDAATAAAAAAAAAADAAEDDEAASVVLLRAACDAYASAARALARRQKQRQGRQDGSGVGVGRDGGGGDLSEGMSASARRSALADAPLQPRPNSIHYNHGVALSTLATALRRRDPAGARRCLERASRQYAAALHEAPGNPQALNNWALVLQELGQGGGGAGGAEAGASSEPAAASAEQQHQQQSQQQQQQSQRQQELIRGALDKFRLALRARPDFDRGCYNLGTVYYAIASAAQAELSGAGAGAAGQAGGTAALRHEARARRDAALRALYGSAGQYICLAHALRPAREVYRQSLAVVRQMLPLPFLRAGYLFAEVGAVATEGGGGPPEQQQERRRRQQDPSAGADDRDRGAFRRRWFVLDHASLRAADDDEDGGDGAGTALRGGGGGGSGALALSSLVPGGMDPADAASSPLALALSGVSGAWRCAEPSLPPGEALWVGVGGTAAAGGGGGGGGGGGAGLYLIAEDADSADAWVDALLLASHLARSGLSHQLAAALAPGGRPAR